MLVLPVRQVLVLRCRANAPDSGGNTTAAVLVDSGSGSGCIEGHPKVSRGAGWGVGAGERVGGKRGHHGARRDVRRGGPMRKRSRLQVDREPLIPDEPEAGSRWLPGEPRKGHTVLLRGRERHRLRSYVDHRRVGPIRAHCREHIAAGVGSSEKGVARGLIHDRCHVRLKAGSRTTHVQVCVWRDEILLRMTCESASKARPLGGNG
jgi:hypothetical protein